MEKERIWKKKAPVTIIGVLVIGIICSALYDIFVKPGINIFSRKIFDLATLGSQSIKDYAFSSAALDPTPMPSTVLLFAFAGAITGMLAGSGSFQVRRAARYQGEQRGRSEKYKPLVLVFSLASTIFIFVTITTINQSVLVWRTFNSNIKIITPYTTEKEIQIINSKFAAMTTELEYNSIYKKLSEIAAENNLKLRDNKTW